MIDLGVDIVDFFNFWVTCLKRLNRTMMSQQPIWHEFLSQNKLQNLASKYFIKFDQIKFQMLNMQNTSQLKSRAPQMQDLTIKNANPQTKMLINVSPVDPFKRPGLGPQSYGKRSQRSSQAKRSLRKSELKQSQKRHKGRKSLSVSSSEKDEIQRKKREKDPLNEYIDSLLGQPAKLANHQSPRVKNGTSLPQNIESNSKGKPAHQSKILLQNNGSFSKNSCGSPKHESSSNSIKVERPKFKFFLSSIGSNQVFGKLFWGKPSFKGNNYVYNEQRMKCEPLFRCEGCLKEFSVASALGGHLSKCPQKAQHAEKVKQKKLLLKNNKKPIKKIAQVSDSQSEQAEIFQSSELQSENESDQSIVEGSQSESQSERNLSSKKVVISKKAAVKEKAAKKQISLQKRKEVRIKSLKYHRQD